LLLYHYHHRRRFGCPYLLNELQYCNIRFVILRRIAGYLIRTLHSAYSNYGAPKMQHVKTQDIKIQDIGTGQVLRICFKHSVFNKKYFEPAFKTIL